MNGSGFFVFGALEAGALKTWINPGGSLRPQSGLHGEQRVDFDARQLPTLFAELRERTLGGASEAEPQLFVRQQAADDSLDRSKALRIRPWGLRSLTRPSASGRYGSARSTPDD